MPKMPEGVRERIYKGKPIKGSYEINFRTYRGGNRVQKIIHAASIAEAKAKRAEMIAEALKTSQLPEDKTRTAFEDIWPVLERNLIGRGRPQATAMIYKNTYYRLFTDYRLKYWPHITIPSQLTLVYFLNYQSYYNIDLKRPKGVRSELRRVKVIINRMRLFKYFSEDLKREIDESLEIPKMKEKEYIELSKTQIKMLLARIKKDRPWLHGPAYFIYRVGRRIQETTLIERDRIKFDNKFNPIIIDIQAETTKANKRAPLNCLDQDLADHVKYHNQLNSKHKAPYLFLNRQGRKIDRSALSDYMKIITKEMFGFSFGAHYFRHRFCTETCRENKPIKDIMAVSGISQVSTLLGYCHSNRAAQLSILETTRL